MRQIQTVHKDSSIPIFGAAIVVVLFSLILPIYRLWAFLLTAALAVGAYFALRVAFPGRDEQTEIEVFTGDKELDEQIKAARATFKKFRAAAEGAKDEKVASSIRRIADAGESVIEEVITDKGDRSDAYTFFSYYTPTLDTLLNHYTGFALAGKGENAQESRRRIEDCLDMVAGSFEKFQDKLYRNEAVEIKASVDTMKLMLSTDGLRTNISPTADPIKQLEQIATGLKTESEMESQAQGGH
ncbi:MAG: 5-bromo-4-chloroindolyl phosphate hydrolysis family protein [Clostridiales bacterium]|nr:5-bromo-4-chloroindolyl phosphate hydrolysis family protein [Clostridiales bacterium]